MKNCPFCASTQPAPEEIQDAAVVCKHCGRDLLPIGAAPSPPTSETTKRLLGCLGVVGVIALVVVVLSIIFGSPDQPPQAQPARARLDAGAFLACRSFAPLVQDVDTGRLTTEEFRYGLKKVYEQARVSPESEVARASSALLELFTTQVVPGVSFEERDRISRERLLAVVRACAPK